jgi:excisionase family DNA binding protein
MVKGMEHDNRLLTVEELADYLGVPVATIYAWRYRREGPSGFRVGKHLRFRWRDVEEWIDHQLQDVRR